MLEETGCDGLMIGRASRGDPWIFRRIRQALNGEKVSKEPTAFERIDLAICHAHMIVEDKGEHTGILQMRTHVIGYLRGLPGATRMRSLLQGADSLSEMVSELEEYRERLLEYGFFDESTR